MTQLSPVTSLFAAATQAAKRLLPERWTRRLRLMANGKPMVGRVDLGDLGRLGPISSHFGEERGTPIDRFYIERFFERHSADIAGHVLEVGDASYSRRFGGTRITGQDVLHVKEGNPHATIVGDLSQPGLLPEAAFDCMIIAQTLMLLYDMHAAAAELKRALKPGGILLLTVPGVTTVDRYGMARPLVLVADRTFGAPQPRCGCRLPACRRSIRRRPRSRPAGDRSAPARCGSIGQ